MLLPRTLPDDLRGPREPRPVVRTKSIKHKGLQAYDEDDSSYFLELLPGPRGGDGIPDSIHFWLERIDQFDSTRTFRVGLLLGPSGSGKSSFVRAGLLPLLPRHVERIYVEADARNTEQRILNGMRGCWPSIPQDLDLVSTCSSLRRATQSGKSQKKRSSWSVSLNSGCMRTP